MDFHSAHESAPSHHGGNHQLYIWLNFTRASFKNHYRYNNLSEHNIGRWSLWLFVWVFDWCGDNNGGENLHFPDPEHDCGQDRWEKWGIQQVLPKFNKLVRWVGLGHENELRPIVVDELRRIRQPGGVHPKGGSISRVHLRVSQVSARVDQS